MIGNEIDISLNSFLSFDFVNKDNHKNRLVLRQNQNEEEYLTIEIKQKKNNSIFKLNLPVQVDSLSKITGFINQNLSGWYSKNNEFKKRLEVQSARLMKKVEEHNKRPLKKWIDYQNPFNWNLTIKFAVSPKIFYEDIIELPHPIENLESFSKIDRLTTNRDLLTLISNLFKQKVRIFIKCTNPEHTFRHEQTLELRKIFSRYTLKENNHLLEANFIISPKEDGKDKMIVIELAKFKVNKMLDILEKIHKNSSKFKGSNDNLSSSESYYSNSNSNSNSNSDGSKSAFVIRNIQQILDNPTSDNPILKMNDLKQEIEIDDFHKSTFPLSPSKYS